MGGRASEQPAAKFSTNHVTPPQASILGPAASQNPRCFQPRSPKQPVHTVLVTVGCFSRQEGVVEVEVVVGWSSYNTHPPPLNTVLPSKSSFLLAPTPATPHKHTPSTQTNQPTYNKHAHSPQPLNPPNTHTAPDQRPSSPAQWQQIWGCQTHSPAQ